MPGPCTMQLGNPHQPFNSGKVTQHYYQFPTCTQLQIISAPVLQCSITCEQCSSSQSVWRDVQGIVTSGERRGRMVHLWCLGLVGVGWGEVQVVIQILLGCNAYLAYFHILLWPTFPSFFLQISQTFPRQLCHTMYPYSVGYVSEQKFSSNYR